MAEFLFSIVFPTYGVELYLRNAVEDILQQTYEKWELIIVDDASPDACGTIADAFAVGDGRIRVIHKKKNEGLSAARNTGLADAKGDYVLFLDPDDRFAHNLLQVLADEITGFHNEWEHAPEVLAYGIYEDYYRGADLQYRKEHSVAGARCRGAGDIYPVTVALEKETLYGYAWNKAYRRAFLKENAFAFRPVTHIEDILFNCDVFDKVNYFSNLCEKLLFYRNDLDNSDGRLTGKYLPDYFDLQKQRVQRLLKQYAGRKNALSAEERREALCVFAAEYVRSFLSMIERESAHGTAYEEILEKCRAEQQGILYQKLLPHYKTGGIIKGAVYYPIRCGFFGAAVMEARMIAWVKHFFPTFYNRMKQKR